jgi:hypothetical protein
VGSTPPPEAAENVPTMNTAMPTTISKGINTPDAKTLASVAPQDNSVPRLDSETKKEGVP